MTKGPGADPELNDPYGVTLNFQGPVLAKERQDMIADCERPIVARMISISEPCPIRQAAGASWFYAGAAPRPRDYQMLIMPFTFFWRMLLAKNRHQGLVAKAS